MACGKAIDDCLCCTRPDCVHDHSYQKTKTYWRHRKIYKLFLDGYFNREIAEKCQVDERTVSRVICEGDIYGLSENDYPHS
jgi:transposase